MHILSRMAFHDLDGEVFVFFVARADPHQDAAMADLVLVILLVVLPDPSRQQRSDNSRRAASDGDGGNRGGQSACRRQQSGHGDGGSHEEEPTCDSPFKFANGLLGHKVCPGCFGIVFQFRRPPIGAPSFSVKASWLPGRLMSE